MTPEKRAERAGSVLAPIRCTGDAPHTHTDTQRETDLAAQRPVDEKQQRVTE